MQLELSYQWQGNDDRRETAHSVRVAQSAIAEIASKGFTEFACRFGLRLPFGEVDYDFDRQIVGKLTRPADNVFFCFFVEIPLTEGEGVKGME
jgi:hypothetical protein